MNILLISSSSSGGGGGELYILKLAEGFIERGNTVTVVYSRGAQFDGLAARAHGLGCTVQRIQYDRIYDLPLRSLSLFLTKPSLDIDASHLRQYDAIHVNMQNVEDGINILSALPANLLNRVTFTIHIVEHLKRLGQRGGWLRQQYPRQVYRRVFDGGAHAVFVSYDAEKRFSEIFGFHASSSSVVYNGAAQYCRNDVPTPPDSDFVIGSMGRLEAQKNYVTLLRAFAQVRTSVPASKLILVGDGSNRELLVSEASRLRISDALTITGWVDSVAAYVSAFDIFALPSHFEGFPFALAEALVNERVCVASDIPGNREAMVGAEQFLFRATDVATLRDKILAIWNDRTAAHRVMTSAWHHAREHFSFEKMITNTLAAYRREQSSRALEC